MSKVLKGGTEVATLKVGPWPAIPIQKPDEADAGLSDQGKEYALFSQ